MLAAGLLAALLAAGSVLGALALAGVWRPEHDVACEVMSDRPVVVERPMYSMYSMYSMYRGTCPAGDTLSGYTFNL